MDVTLTATGVLKEDKGLVKVQLHFAAPTGMISKGHIIPKRTPHSIRRVCERIYNDLKNAAINARGELVEAI